jgi:ribonuclease E
MRAKTETATDDNSAAALKDESVEANAQAPANVATTASATAALSATALAVIAIDRAAKNAPAATAVPVLTNEVPTLEQTIVESVEQAEAEAANVEAEQKPVATPVENTGDALPVVKSEAAEPAVTPGEATESTPIAATVSPKPAPKVAPVAKVTEPAAKAAPAIVIRPTGRAANDPRDNPNLALSVEIVTEHPVPMQGLPPAQPVIPQRGPQPRAINDPRLARSGASSAAGGEPQA